MSDVFISYARSTAARAQQVAEALRSMGYGVWWDGDLPAHRAYAEVIEERLKAAKAVVVIWSAEAAKSEWVQSEADRARADRKLVQLTVDRAALPMPFDRIQCADLADWSGDMEAPGWRKVISSITELVGEPKPVPPAGVPPQLPGKPSIALLPFTNLSGDPEQDYFADGMVEEIARALSRFKSIFVIGGSSSLSFKGKGTTPQEAARLLGVRYVLEGSVRKAGARVRIAVKLIDGANGAQIWADRFEDTLDDVFALQDKVALSVAGVIEPAVREAEIRRASARPTENMGSYDLCLRAVSLLRTVAKADVLAALDLLTRAIALDPDYGFAMAVAMLCHGTIYVNGWSDNPERHLSEARKLSQRAIKVGGDDPDVLLNLATATLRIRGDLETAASLADRAMALNPGSAPVWLVNGIVRLFAGEPKTADEYFQTSLRMDPLSPDQPLTLGWLGLTRFAREQYREAVPLLKQAAQLRPEWPLPCVFLIGCYGHLGEMNAASE
ncbi:MAG TPA: TIR domain-containing protein, partial [Caulobacteraceae bacterium]|nr:TIR domain-containing protein [Caulobacteraceae bacterium]